MKEEPVVVQAGRLVVSVYRCQHPGPEGPCGRATPQKCEFELRGRKTGRQCGRPVCQGHGVERGSQLLCQAHARLLVAEAARRRR